ncbi:MAG: allantoinase [Acidobacteriota bacterium]|jgi:allantoinase|nr:allantoinase [Acidobacteriota bacterium]
MPSTDLCIRGQRVITPDSEGPAAVHIRDGRIAAVGSFEDVPENCSIVEAGDSVVLPGLVDSHVHVNEPGRTRWEGFATATRAAAAGGVTTIVDMPLNSVPPTTTTEGLREKLDAARGQCRVDVAFWGGLVPGNLGALAQLYAGGVVGFKCFLIPSGVQEFPHMTESELLPALYELARLDAPLIVHAEMPGPVERAHADCCEGEAAGDPRRYETFLRSRPREAENEAVALMLKLCRETGARVHIVHHSSADALPLLREAKALELAFTAETCPHYLLFAAEDVPDGATEFKCCPPIRERENRERLWEALGEGTIDMIVSDHSPCPPEMKRRSEGDFMKAWGGISSLQFRLPVIWTEARRRGHTLKDLARWLSREPARLAGLLRRKGSITVGRDADLVIFDPDATFRITPETNEHRHKLTPYEGREFTGVVEATYLRGEKIYERGKFAETPTGELILREDEPKETVEWDDPENFDDLTGKDFDD